MSASRLADDRAWLADQVAKYEKLRPHYRTYADVLAAVLRRGAQEIAPLAIVQSREKSMASFAEKAMRKRGKYACPVSQLTDLCGARVIMHTRSEVDRFCRFVERSFEIDRANSVDASERLKPAEFGYRSVHYIVSFLPDHDYGVPIPGEVLGLKAEVQLRTLVEHAYADFGHDLTYKGAFTLPTAWLRELASAAAALEEVDQIFSRIETRLREYATSYGKHLSGEKLQQEMDLLRAILEHDPGNRGLAARLGKLAMTREDWPTAIAVLSRHVDAGRPEAAAPAILCDLGVALCKAHAPGSAEYRTGQHYLEIAGAGDEGSVDALCSLAGTYKGMDEERVRALYRAAFQRDPADPYALGNYLECELQRGIPILDTAQPLIRMAAERCEAHIAAGINLPWACTSLGRFHLLLGDPHAGLAAYAKAVDLSTAEWMLETSRRSIERLAAASPGLEGAEWVRRLLVVGMAARFGSPAAVERACRLASPGRQEIRRPVCIVAGGTADGGDRPGAYALLAEALAGFDGTLISGGTTSGVCEVVGDAAQRRGERIFTCGYVPGVVPPGVTVDRDPARYRELRATDGTGFSPLEPLQYWADLVASGVRPAEVRVLGVGGGAIAAAEYQIALGLGASVGVVAGSGGAAARIAADRHWATSRLIVLPADVQTVRAFLGSCPGALPADECETIARAIHEQYRVTRAESVKPANRGLRDWDKLDEDLRESNRAQARHIVEKLRDIGCSLGRAGAGEGGAPFSRGEVERLAEMEHGRYNAERLLEGWRWGETRDEDLRLSPYLVAWADLPDDIRELDRQTVRKIPEFLAQVGLAVRRNPAPAGAVA